MSKLNAVLLLKFRHNIIIIIISFSYAYLVIYNIDGTVKISTEFSVCAEFKAATVNPRWRRTLFYRTLVVRRKDVAYLNSCIPVSMTISQALYNSE